MTEVLIKGRRTSIKKLSKNLSRRQNRYWKVLKYTKLKTNGTTPAILGLNNQVAITMQVTKALVRAHIFLKALFSWGIKYKSRQRSAYLSVSQEMVARALLYQSVNKVVKPNIPNFQALELI